MGGDNWIQCQVCGELHKVKTKDTSEDDLFIDGNGSLTVNANYNDGIASNDDLKVLNGNIRAPSFYYNHI